MRAKTADEKATRAAYMRAWTARLYANHPEKRQEHRDRAKRWRAANRERCNERARAWRKNNPDKAKRHKMAWIQKNPDKFKSQVAVDAARYRKRHAEKRAEANAAWRGLKPWAWLARSARHRANKLGVAFDIRPEDIQKIWPADNRCPITGLVLKRSKGRMCNASPSLDRINPHFGYVVGNIAILSAKANRQKGEMTADQHRAIADWMDRMIGEGPHAKARPR